MNVQAPTTAIIFAMVAPPSLVVFSQTSAELPSGLDGAVFMVTVQPGSGFKIWLLKLQKEQ
jgi:hypothetical protein